MGSLNILSGSKVKKWKGAWQEAEIIVGSGAIGSEFASFYHDMGVKVTLVEALEQKASETVV